MTIRLLHGDCRSLLRTLPDESVHCVVTSPPYYGLRDYSTGKWEGGEADCDHVERTAADIFRANGLGKILGYRDSLPADNAAFRSREKQFRSECGKCNARRIDSQIGLESSPEAYIAELVAVFREVHRVLRKDGTLWLNLGDGFADKQLLMMPARVALALQADGWWLRSEIIWAKPNPMPESVTDRPTSAHEKVFLLAKSSRYFYDAEAVAVPASDTPGAQAWRRIFDPARQEKEQALKEAGIKGGNDGARDRYASTRNLRNVWTIATSPFAEAHFATFPPDLIIPCIKAGTSEKGCCPHCGRPWERVTERVASTEGRLNWAGHAASKDGRSRNGGFYDAQGTTLGWSPRCSCPEHQPVPATVLDPFGGAGTTGLVADRLGRNAILIELNPNYAAMAKRRVVDDCPLFAEVQTMAEAAE
jgi:DNA modification methylase